MGKRNGKSFFAGLFPPCTIERLSRVDSTQHLRRRAVRQPQRAVRNESERQKEIKSVRKGLWLEIDKCNCAKVVRSARPLLCRAACVCPSSDQLRQHWLSFSVSSFASSSFGRHLFSSSRLSESFAHPTPSGHISPGTTHGRNQKRVSAWSKGHTTATHHPIQSTTARISQRTTYLLASAQTAGSVSLREWWSFFQSVQ